MCDNCGAADVTLRLVTRSFGAGSTLLVIENIPMAVCARCGVSYFSARTMHEIERIKRLRASLAEGREVPVATFVSET